MPTKTAKKSTTADAKKELLDLLKQHPELSATELLKIAEVEKMKAEQEENKQLILASQVAGAWRGIKARYPVISIVEIEGSHAYEEIDDIENIDQRNCYSEFLDVLSRYPEVSWDEALDAYITPVTPSKMIRM